MKFIRFKTNNKVFSGTFEADNINYTGDDGTNVSIGVNEVKILPPVMPSKIIAVGLNYKDHAKELNMQVSAVPVIFLKPPTAIIAHQEAVVYPPMVSRLDYEAELAVVIGKKAKDVSKQNYKEYIKGYTCFNDITARDLQQVDGQWTRAKSFDTFAPIGPVIVNDIDPSDLRICTYVNDKLSQSSNTSNMIFKIPELIEFISSIMTLMPDDIIATGTPPNVGPLNRGDTVIVEIEGIGRLINHIE